MMEDLSLHILDIAENSVSAGAKRISVAIDEDEPRDILVIRIADNGRGMTAATLRRARDPFFSSKGKATGLGLPLLAQAAEHCGGGLRIVTARRKGTTVTARFRLGHVDRPPLTNMAGTMTTLVLAHPEIDFRYRHRRRGQVFRFSSLPFGRHARASSGTSAGLIAEVREALRTGLRGIGTT